MEVVCCVLAGDDAAQRDQQLSTAQRNRCDAEDGMVHAGTDQKGGREDEQR